jgi:predicted 3-demethylubiquinone-9 3-methyltransferase (glyoxalase superfamily)
MPAISPFLWFDTQAEEAARLYCSIFPNSRVLNTSRYAEGGPSPAGQVMTVTFELDGQRFTALNGGPRYSFTEAVSFVVPCETQAELDAIWDRLLEGGKAQACGWLKDRFGLSWQVVPAALGRLMSDPDLAKSGRVMHAMLKMVKFDIAELERAARG